MSRLLFASLLAAAPVGAAEEKASLAGEVAPLAKLSPLDPSRTKSSRVISPEMSARLVATTPKFVPPPEPGSTPPAVALPREPDRPRNQIIRLPRYIVAEPKLPPMMDRQLWTPKGRLDEALKRRPGLRIGSFFGLNNAVALEMLEGDLWFQRQKEEAELWSLYRITAPEAGDGVRLRPDRSSTRSNEWIDQRLTPRKPPE